MFMFHVAAQKLAETLRSILCKAHKCGDREGYGEKGAEKGLLMKREKDRSSSSEKNLKNDNNYYKKIYKSVFLVGIFSVICLFILFLIDYFFKLSVSLTLERHTIFTYMLAIAAIIIAIHIALNQISQINKLEKISGETRETIETLKTKSIIEDNVNKFLVIKSEDRIQKKYTCYYPVEYRDKPLPLINQGDFYAIHVLSTLLGENILDLRGVTRDEFFDKSKITGDVIFVCSPKANPALKAIFEARELKEGDNEEILEKWLKELDLPCWFVEDSRGRQNGNSIRKIKIYYESDEPTINILLKSPAESQYEEASKYKGKSYIPEEMIQRDYGIFARITKESNQYIIIAGIHQFGTWIVGSLLNNLLCKNEVDYDWIFKDVEDFICIISGEFDNNKLKVNDKTIEVLHHYIWVKENDRWIRKYRAPSSHVKR